MKRAIATIALSLGLVAMTATAQDMMRHVDLSSPDMVSAEMTRAEVEAVLAATTGTAAADFTGKRLARRSPRPFRSQLFRGDFSRRTTQQNEARWRQT